MAEINDLTVVDANNTARFPEGVLASSVNDSARALEGILARWNNDTNASIASGGTGDVITVAATRTLSAYYDGLTIAFDAAAANTGATTLNVDGVAASAIVKNVTGALVANDIVADQKVVVIYSTANSNWQIVSPLGNAPGTGDGDVVGPASATDGAVATYDGTTGKLLKDGVTLGTVATLDSGTGSGDVPLVGTKSSTTTLAGTVERSTSAENVTGTDDTVTPTVAGVKEMIDTHASAGGGWAFVSASTASASATIAFTGLASGYDYLIEAYGAVAASDAVNGELFLGVAGPTYRTTNYVAGSGGTTTGGSGVGSAIQTTYIPTDGNVWGNAATEEGNFSFVFFDPAAALATRFLGNCVQHENVSSLVGSTGGGHHTVAEAMDAIKFQFSAGNITSGEFKLYRRLNA